MTPPEDAFRGYLIGAGGVGGYSPSDPLPDGQPSISPPEACHHGGDQQVGIHERVMRASCGGQEELGGGQEGVRLNTTALCTYWTLIALLCRY